MKSFPFLFIFLISCQPKGNIHEVKGENIQLVDSTAQDKKLSKLISPYQKNMALEMNQQIGEADHLLNNSKTEVESDLGNLMADVVFENGIKYLQSTNDSVPLENCFALINKGGIRSSISKGPITIGNIFKVMPFDNKIVILRLSAEKMKSISMYLFQHNGQPVSNASFILSKLQTRIKIGSKIYDHKSPFYVITSDYLASGGDKMSFFKNPLSVTETNILIRDALLDKVRAEESLVAPVNIGRVKIEL